MKPSPALVIALLALFLSLGGVSYGVATGFIDSREIKDGTIRSKDVRDNQLRGRDIRNRSIGPRDVALDALRGPHVDERSLARVPGADDAAALAGRRRVNVAPFTLAAGQAREVLREGPFTLTARCRLGAPTGDGVKDVAEVVIATSVDDAAFDGADSGELDAATPDGDRTFLDAAADPGQVAVDSLQDGLAVAPDGSEEIADSNLYAMVGALGRPGSCRFGGYIDLG